MSAYLFPDASIVLIEMVAMVTNEAMGLTF